MPYDLYGQYYDSYREAENAEMAQCANIDARRAMKELDEEKTKSYYLEQRVDYLQQRIEALEEAIKTKEK